MEKHVAPQPLQYRPLSDIDEVEPLGKEDEACVQEMKAVLKKHNALQRFGICLLHDHFPLRDDERLVEVCDKANRTLTIKPVKKSECSDAKLIETSWRLDVADAVVACTVACHSSSAGHDQQHIPTTQ